MLERNLLSLEDLNPLELATLLDLAAEMKTAPATASVRLHGRTIGLLFERPSTRTRVAAALAAEGLGAHALILNTHELRLSEGETLEDTVLSLGLYVDALIVRTPGHDRVERIADSAAVPVINAGTDVEHPTQALTDLFTLRERCGPLRGMRIAFVGEAGPAAHSLMVAAALTGMDLRLACPQGHEPFASITDTARQLAQATGATITAHDDPEDAVLGATVIYTDRSGDHSTGQGNETRFQVNQDLLAHASREALVMHPLPARRGDEIAAAVLDGPRAVVIQQAQNKVPTLKAALVWLLG